MDLVIALTGDIRCVYDESIDLRSFGQVSIRRGSHVEPTSNGQWTADLSPVEGPILGPFDTRTDALDAEVTWLRNHWVIPGG
ncbi:hypothetical protein [Schlesneria sp.]|uniref:hypothetical protein n=1 Tax=Schlesneria sp. TaxID=2762018 RepID=UPI003F7D5725